MQAVRHLAPLREEEQWDGKERRSLVREKFETNPVPIPKELREGINRRVQRVLETGDSATFSCDAYPLIRYGDYTILRNNAPWTLHRDAADVYGQSVHGETQDGSWRIENKPMSKQKRFAIQNLPIKVIPHVPIDPSEIHLLAANHTLGFEHLPTKTMALIVWSAENGWSDIYYCPAGDIATPATARRYGEEIFGGIVAFRLPNSGEVVMLRPELHTRRFFNNAARMCMADFRDRDGNNDRHVREFTEQDMQEMLRHVVRANIDYIPSHNTGGRLYLSPVAYAAGQHLSATRNEKIVIATEAFPVGRYFQDPLSLKIETRFHRVGPGMMGDVKAGGGYVTCFEPELLAAEEGFDKCLYLDTTNKRVLELNAANIFFVIGDHLITPDLTGEILEGVTRNTVLQMAERDPALRGKFSRVQHTQPVHIKDLAAFFQDPNRPSIKAFVTGTAAIIHRVESLYYEGLKLVCDAPKHGETDIIGVLSERFRELTDGQLEKHADSEVRTLYKDMLVRVFD